MRAFLLIALLAMAATVSCEDVSPACNVTSTALESNANITAAQKNIGQGGCTEISFDNCPQTDTSIVCTCVTTYANKSAWETAVTSAGGRACYVDFSFTLSGNRTIGNVTRVVGLTASQTAFTNLAVGSNCTQADIGLAMGGGIAQASQVLESLVSGNQKGNFTWTSGSATITACGAVKTVTKTIGGGATSTPTTATSAPTSTAAPTTTPAPTGSSSTGKSGASIIASSAALVASLIAAVTILA